MWTGRMTVSIVGARKRRVIFFLVRLSVSFRHVPKSMVVSFVGSMSSVLGWCLKGKQLWTHLSHESCLFHQIGTVCLTARSGLLISFSRLDEYTADAMTTAQRMIRRAAFRT